MTETKETLDEVYTRLRNTGPEFDGWLSNHGPMAAEALVRNGHQDDVWAWLDSYCARLDEAPTASGRIGDWKADLGKSRLLPEWLEWFDEQLSRQPWTTVLEIWWPRLLPGIAAGATHGVIRTGHAVRVLREHGQTPERVAELGQALGYWAARWQPVPQARQPIGSLDAERAIAELPSAPHLTGGIRDRLARLPGLEGWTSGQAALEPDQDPFALLRQVIVASVRRYATHAHDNPVMLVHAATAPNAVLRVLPSLPAHLWVASAEATWSASAAVHVAYSTPEGRSPSAPPPTATDGFDRAAQHGDEHAIKLADTAVDAYAWTGDETTLAAIVTATELIEPA